MKYRYSIVPLEDKIPRLMAGEKLYLKNGNTYYYVGGKFYMLAIGNRQVFEYDPTTSTRLYTRKELTWQNIVAEKTNKHLIPRDTSDSFDYQGFCLGEEEFLEAARAALRYLGELE